MVKRFFFILTYFISLSISAQRDTIIAGRRCHLVLDTDTGTAWIQTKTIKKKTGEQFRGAYFEFYKSGRLKVKGFYKSGKRSDKWIGYYEDGNMSFQGYFDNGYKSDLWMEYFPGGHMSWKGSFFKDMRAGFWRYFYVNGKLRSMTRFEIHTRVENVSGAPAKSKGKSFKINKKIHYSITPCDSLVEYYQDGTLKIRILYGHHGGLNGKCEYFYADGKKNFEGTYVDEKKSKTWNWYCVDGKIAKFMEYDDKGALISSGSNLDKFPDCI